MNLLSQVHASPRARGTSVASSPGPLTTGVYLAFCVIPVGIYLVRPRPRARDGRMVARAAGWWGRRCSSWSGPSPTPVLLVPPGCSSATLSAPLALGAFVLARLRPAVPAPQPEHHSRGAPPRHRWPVPLHPPPALRGRDPRRRRAGARAARSLGDADARAVHRRADAASSLRGGPARPDVSRVRAVRSADATAHSVGVVGERRFALSRPMLRWIQ